jgi:hypothetical protein
MRCPRWCLDSSAPRSSDTKTCLLSAPRSTCSADSSRRTCST